MNYLYHRVPIDMRGTILYPLNSLADVYPDIYKTQMQKYDHRLHVTAQRIPTLQNCAWNDVIFMTATHPSIIKTELERIDNDTKQLWRYFKIDPRTLDQAKTTIYLFRQSDFTKPLQTTEFVTFDADNLDQYAQLPNQTIEYWQNFDPSAGKKRLLYMHIPHILYKGPIDVSGAEIIEV